MLNVQRAQLANIPYDANARQLRDLIARTLTFELILLIYTDLTISGGTTDGTVKAENPLTLVQFLRIYEAGEVILEIDPRALAQLTERNGAKAGSGVSLTSGAAQTVSLYSLVRIQFAHPLSINPIETAFRPVDPAQSFQLEVEWATDRKGALVSAANDRTFSFSNTVVRVIQVHDPEAFKTYKPLFLPRLRRQDQAISAAQANMPFELKTNQRIRAVLLHTLQDGVSANLIQKFTFKDDVRRYFDQVQRLDWHETEQFDYGGATDQAGYLFVNFAQNGKLGNTWDPMQGAHPTFELDVTHPGTTDIVRGYWWELVQVPGITA